MPEVADRVTRFAADLVDSAAAEGARQSRSAKQQLDHWARVGRAVSAQQSAARRRVEAALAGHLDTGALTAEEGVVFNAEISAAIEENLSHTHYGDILAERGVTTVALDDDGRIVEYRPDGTSVFLVNQAGDVLYRRQSARSALVLARLAPIREAGAAPLQDAAGETVLTGYAPLAQGRWAIVTQRTLDHVLSPLRALLAESLRFAVPAFVLTLALVCALAYAVASPLSRLSRALVRGQDAGRDLDRLPAWYAEADTLREAVKTTLAQHRREVGRLNRETLTDPMTGLMNRRALDEALADYEDKQEPFAVIALDLDHFKRINDTHGHAVGDQVLIALAQAMREGLRGPDRPFRTGGEEFIALLPTDRPEQAAEVAERLRAAVAARPMPEGVGAVTVSIGVALWPRDGAAPQAVIERADQALYASKQDGRNRVTLWRAS